MESAATWEPLSALQPWKSNPRDNSKAVAEVAKSIRRFGWGAPIVANKRDGEIIAGHTRYAAAERLKLDLVPVRWLDLDPADAHALALADNKVGEMATWDDATLRQVLAELKAADESLLADTGFSDEELAALLGDVTPTVLEPEGELPEVDEAGPVHSVLGEVYELGPHRLMCGDSTSVDDVDALMAGDKADCVWTDPPYGMSYAGGRGKKAFGMIKNDDTTGDDLISLVRDAMSNAKLSSKEESAAYCCFPWRTYSEFEAAFVSAGYAVDACIVWNKGSIGLGFQDYRPQHEFMFYSSGKWFGDRAQSDVWTITRDSHHDYAHPTQKPVQFVQVAIENSTQTGALVLDVFGGSGTTLIACAQTNRTARLMELDPRYCDVIRRRWTRWAKANGVDAGSGALDG